MSVLSAGKGHQQQQEDAMIALPKRNNPNVEEVFQPVSVSQQQQQQQQNPATARALVYSGGDNEYDNLLGKYVRPRIELRIRPPLAQQPPGKDKEEEDDKDAVYDDRDEVITPSSYSSSSPSSAYYGGNGGGGGGGTKRNVQEQKEPDQQEQRELINFEAAKRHLEAKARVLSDPVIQFVSAIAVKTGTGVHNMLINASLPLINVNAASVDDLINGSRFSREALLVLLAQVVVEQGEAVLASSAKQEQSIASSPKRAKGMGGGGDDDDVEDMTPVVVKLEPKSVKKDDPGSVKKTVQAAISFIESAVMAETGSFDDGCGGIRNAVEDGYSLIGARPPINPMPPGLFRLPRQGGGGGGQVTDQLSTLLREVANASGVAEWAWHQMPENSGLALIKPEVVAIIQTAYEDIRAISPAHSKFKLWHLITGPRVRQHFSMMIAGMLNAAPSEIQYPHYQKSVRDNGAVTGARVSTGVMTTIRSAALYREKLLWFKSVGYTESAQWKALRERQEAGAAKAELEIARRAVDRCEAELVQQMNAFWNSLTPDTQEMAGDLFDAFHRPNTDVPESVKRSMQRALMEATPRTAVGGVPVIGRVVMANVAGLVPFAPGYEAIGVETPYPWPDNANQGQPHLFTRRPLERLIGDPERRPDSVLIPACDTALAELNVVAKRIASWTASASQHQQVIFNLTGAFERFKASLLAVKAAIRTVLSEQTQMASITEDATVELVYSRIDTRPPMRDYSVPYSRYATE